MTGGRLPAHLEVTGLIRAVENAGGFAAVLSKGERDAGTILLVTRERGLPARLWERMPQRDGARRYTVGRTEDTEKKEEFESYLSRRTMQDSDCWLVELEIANPERLIADMAS